ncbi:deoxynucleoside kinase-like [Cylas formicarius]|uniref:deoxynucleoside kinase-like n=1 Tax=Cylas formicarius TaxID=197179 RepID=UPI0029585E4D|nr:deoxynucleoside kinase-like [Cylas formicarius]
MNVTCIHLALFRFKKKLYIYSLMFNSDTESMEKIVSTAARLTRPFTVVVEGNIGSGKTSFLNHFSKHKDVMVLTEPVNLWRNCNGHNLLGLMYENPVKWSFTFQSYVQLTMLQNHQKRTHLPVKLMERSIFSARYCFVEKLARDGLLPKPSAAVIDKWFRWVLHNADVDVDLVVYLRTSPETAYERILKRNRSEEETISFDYVKSLHEIHEQWLYRKTLWECPAPTLVLDADLDMSVIISEYDKCEPFILNKVSVPLEARAM